MHLTGGANGGHAQVYNSTEKVVVSINHVLSHPVFGRGIISVSSPDGYKEVVRISNDGDGYVSVSNSDGKKGVSIDNGEGAGGRVDVYNPFGKNVATMQSSKTNTGLIILKDVNGKPTASLYGDK